MSGPVPPRLIRRVLRDPLWPVLIGAGALLLGLLALPCLLVAPFTRRRRALRLIRMGLACLALELRIVLGCWRLWCVHPPWRRDERRWRAAHAALLDRSLSTCVAVAQRAVGLRLRLDVPAVAAPGVPLLMLARHIGAGDSLLVAHLVVHHLGRTPRVMLKRILLWDAAADLLLGRLGCYFLPPRRVGVTQREEQLERFARSLGPDDALLLFPEGGNWSPRRHASSLEWATKTGNTALREWMQDHPRVLAPRAKGTREMLEESPDLVPVIVAHHGLDKTGTPAQIWSALPLAEPVDMVTRQVEQPETHELADVERWLQQHWSQIDRWAGRLGGD